MEPPEYEPEYFGVLDRSSRSSGFWMDSFISDDHDELHYKPAMGSYVEIFADRSTEERRHFVMGLEHGVRTRYWPGGRLRARSNYKDGLKEGIAKSWHLNGKIATRRNFTRGKLVGEVERWSEAGEYQPATVEAKELPSNSGQSVENDHGWLRTRGGRYGKYYDSRSGCLAEGDYATYFDNGKIEYKVTFVGGLANGRQTFWWPNGSLRTQNLLKDGLGEGLGQSWHFNGQLARRRFMKAGEFDGLYETWSPTGQKTWETSYKDGNYHGYEKGFDEDGKLSWCVYYRHGIKLADFYGYELLE